MRGAGYAVLKDPDKLTAGQSEAFSNRIKVTVRMAYGFHHVDNLIAMINSDAPAYPSDCRSPSSNPRKQQKPHFFIASTGSSTDMDAV